jgi:hypothetical protein
MFVFHLVRSINHFVTFVLVNPLQIVFLVVFASDFFWRSDAEIADAAKTYYFVLKFFVEAGYLIL